MQTDLYDPKLHLMLDDHELRARRAVERVLGRPKKLGVVVGQDRAWEEPWVYAWGSVVHNREADRLEMFYETAGFNNRHALTRTCRAVSRDGLHWDKPPVGQYAMKGAVDTNIVTLAVGKRNEPEATAALLCEAQVRYLGKGKPLHEYCHHYDGTNVVRDDNEPDPSKRYKYLVCMWTPEHSDEEASPTRPVFDHYLFTSPDGIRWDMPPKRVLKRVMNDGTKLTWDQARKLWMLTGLNDDHHADGTHIRVPVMTQSADLLHWDPVHRPFPLDEQDDGGRLIQGHFIQPFLYGNQYVGYFSPIHTLEGWCRSFLLSSRDGKTFERPLRYDPFIELGHEHDFDADSAEAAIAPPVLVGDDLITYYCGRARRHDPSIGLGVTGAIGAVSIKRDRFAGLAHGGWFNRAANNNVSRDGEIVTTPVAVTGPTLYLNARSRFQRPADLKDNPNLWGALTVELLDENEKPIPGYTMDEGVPVWDDAVRIPMRWRERGDVSQLVGRKVALRIRINRATLFAYIFDR